MNEKCLSRLVLHFIFFCYFFSILVRSKGKTKKFTLLKMNISIMFCSGGFSAKYLYVAKWNDVVGTKYILNYGDILEAKQHFFSLRFFDRILILLLFHSQIQLFFLYSILRWNTSSGSFIVSFVEHFSFYVVFSSLLDIQDDQYLFRCGFAIRHTDTPKKKPYYSSWN